MAAPLKKLLKVNRGGQLTLPARLRQELGLYEGDHVEISVTSEGLLIRPVDTHYRKLSMAQLVEQTEKALEEGRYSSLKSQADIDGFIDDL